VTLTISLPPVIVDASIAVDAVQAEREALIALERWVGERRMLLAPAIVWPEVGQALLKGGRPAVNVAGRLELLATMGLETADRGPRGVAFALALAERHRLSVHDATYLGLAIDVDGELATRDRALARAAEAEGVPLAIEFRPAP
jgi:predicted nucleic acid-binding protein